MNKLEKAELYHDLGQFYKCMMISLYTKYSNYSSAVIREEVSYWITTHNHQKNLDLLAKRKKRKTKVKKLKEAINQYLTESKNRDVVNEIMEN